MERTKHVGLNPDANNIEKWKKLGGGSFRLNGHIIKPGQTFKAMESEIPVGFRDVVVRADEAPVGIGKAPAPRKVSPPEIKPVEVVYTKKARATVGWFDVVDSNGKALNEKALREDIADKLVRDLAK